MKKSFWTATIVATVGLVLFLPPGIREAQGKGGSGHSSGGGGGASRSGSNSHPSSANGAARGGSANYGGRGYAPYGGRGYYGGYYGGNYGLGLGLGLGYPGYYPGYSYGGLPYSDGFGYSGAPRYSLYPDAATESNYPANFSTELRNPNDAGFIVRVPDPNAEVWFQNYQTQQQGFMRHYESGQLDPNGAYTFTVRARWNQNGQPMDQTRQVNAQAGQNLTVDFTNPVHEQVPTLPQRQQQQPLSK